ncbi:MAG: DUF4230 domain-containing protein [Bacteroidales bacterium]|nr:DUF4230 domain-containing protein [Bacteroidales bacterium]
MKTKSSIFFLIAAILFVVASCGNDMELKTIHIAALKQIRFYRWNSTPMKVESVKDNMVFDDNLIGVYSGHIDIGIDFDHGFKSRIDGDSIVHITAKLEILNTDKWFVDDFKYMETGSFDNSERKVLDAKANRLIYEKCISEGTVQKAKENMEAQIRDLLTHQFHFKKVYIDCIDATGM